MKKLSKRREVVHRKCPNLFLNGHIRLATLLQFCGVMKIRNLILLPIFCLSLSSFADSKNHKYQDADYKNAVCDLMNGTTEVKIKGYGRADCVSDKYAAEIEFVDLWSQGIAQAERYAKGTKKKGLLALIAENDVENSLAKNIKVKLNKSNPKIEVRIYTTAGLKDHLPQDQVCAKLSTKRICHLVNTGSYASTEKFTPFASYRACIEAGGKKPGNVGVPRLKMNAEKAFKDGVCKNADIGKI